MAEPVLNIILCTYALINGALKTSTITELIACSISDGSVSWFARSGRSINVIPAPEFTMSIVSGLYPSPDSQWLAIVSVGEGHPLIHITRLPSDPANAYWPMTDIWEINPFPGTADIQGNLGGWLGGRLLINSDILLTNNNEILDNKRLFVFDPITGQINQFNAPCQRSVTCVFDQKPKSLRVRKGSVWRE